MTTKNAHQQEPEINESERAQKVQSLREMILSAEKTIQSAKAMLLQLEGKKKSGRKRKFEEESDGTVIQGVFDGQVMIGTDGKQYPVPANYASKSKLVEGDTLKLTITPDGSFIYKQIGPIERRHAIGIVTQDEAGNYYIIAEGKPLKVLLASVTYFKLEPGDEVAVMLPRDIDTVWAAIENVLQKGRDKSAGSSFEKFSETLEELKKNPKTSDEPRTELRAYGVDNDDAPAKPSAKAIIDEWTPDIEALEQEIRAGQNS